MPVGGGGGPPTITYTAGRGALVDGSVVTNSSKEASMLFHSVTMITPDVVALEATNGSRVEWLDCFTYFADIGINLTQGTSGFASLGLKYGAEVRSIGSANVYGNYGTVADGANTLAYLISHNFAYIGTGTDTTNDPRLVIQANEVVETNNGHIYYESVDHKGDFRIGDIFLIDQDTGAVTFNAQALTFTPTGSITLTGPTSSAFVNYTQVQVGNIVVHDNNIDSLIGPVNFSANSGATYLNTNVFVTGNTTVSADISVDGNLYLGNQSTDTITVFSNLTQDLLPDDLGPGGGFSLGNTLTRWNTLYSAALTVDNVTQITNNTISTLTTDTDLIFKANGSGKIIVTNTNVSGGQDLTVNGTILTINGTTNLKDTVIRSETVTPYTTTPSVQNVAGADGATGFFFLGSWAGNPQIGLQLIQPGWTCVQLPGAVVTGTNESLQTITITGGVFVSGAFYTFTGNVTTYGPATLTQTGNIGQTGNTYITGDVLVSNTKNLTITGAGSYFTVPDFKLQNNEISVTATDQDLILQGLGSGGVVFEDLVKFSGTQIEALVGLTLTENGALLVTENGVPYALEGDIGATESLRFAPNGTGNTIIDTDKSIRIPVGDNSTRILTFGEIRYNSTSNLYEGGGATGGLISFNGLYDSDRNTYITAGATDNTIYFGISNLVKATIDNTSLNSSVFKINNVQFSNNTISNTVSGNDLIFSTTGNTILTDVGVSENYIINLTDNPLILSSTGTGYIKFNGTNGLVVPVGDDSQRRGTPELGELRYNTQAAGVLEVFDGNNWTLAVGNNATVSAEDVLDILDLWTLILG